VPSPPRWRSLRKDGAGGLLAGVASRLLAARARRCPPDPLATPAAGGLWTTAMWRRILGHRRRSQPMVGNTAAVLARGPLKGAAVEVCPPAPALGQDPLCKSNARAKTVPPVETAPQRALPPRSAEPRPPSKGPITRPRTSVWAPGPPRARSRNRLLSEGLSRHSSPLAWSPDNTASTLQVPRLSAPAGMATLGSGQLSARGVDRLDSEQDTSRRSSAALKYMFSRETREPAFSRGLHRPWLHLVLRGGIAF
jgi:hypothetical protein